MFEWETRITSSMSTINQPPKPTDQSWLCLINTRLDIKIADGRFFYALRFVARQQQRGFGVEYSR